MYKKILLIIAIVLIVLKTLIVPTYAAEQTAPVESTATVETTHNVLPQLPEPDPELEALKNKVAEAAKTFKDPEIVYTSDSVDNGFIWLEPWVDTVKYEVGFTIEHNLEFGKEIYDDPSTDYIDGIRINGMPIYSYRYTMDLDAPPSLIEVKAVYKEGLSGALAKISDGKFDYSIIVDNPVILLQVIYYIIALLALLISSITVAFSKKKRVKTAEDISKQVDDHAKYAQDAIRQTYVELLKQDFMPILESVINSNAATVKAIALSTSKNKEAPLAILDVLQDVSNLNVGDIIVRTREVVAKQIADNDVEHERTEQVLNKIAEGTYQEGPKVETNTKEDSPVAKKSVF